MENNKPVSLEDLNGVTEHDENFVDVTAAVEVTDDKHEISVPVEVDITAIKDYSTPETEPTMADDLFSKLDKRLVEEKKVIEETRAKAEDIIYENQLADEEKKELEEEDVEDILNFDKPAVSSTVRMKRNINIPKVDPSEVDVENTLHNINEKDFLDDLDIDDEETKETKEEEEAKVKQAKDAVSEKIIPIQNKIDMNKFSISKKPISISRLLSMDTTTGPVADWILYTAGRSVSMSGLHGAEIDKLNPTNSNRNRLNTYKDMYQIIYNHIVDANKPITFESWLKTVKFFDIDHLYFAIYRATFAGTNSVPYTCTNPKCEKVFMNDLPFDDMVKYATPEVKAKVASILSKDSTTETDEYNVDLVQISDQYVVALKDPTAYSVIFETAALDDKITEKYQDLIGVMAYIDEIYFINRDTNELSVVDTKPDATNAVKTTMRKFKAYYQILNSLTSDQFYNMSGSIKKITDHSSEVSYIMPAATCPHCGTLVEEEKRTPEQLLFMRHQLAAIVNI